MKKVSIVIAMGVLYLSSSIVSAKTCYIDNTGQEKNSYKTINESLSNNCQSIILKSGEYVEDIRLEEGARISSNSKTIIKGTVRMSGSSGLKGVSIGDPMAKDSNGRSIGIKIENNAKAIIYGVEVFGADIGIETSESSSLTIMDSKIRGNNKGFYIRYGTAIDIRNNEVIDNNEEGIDVRAGITGKISGNKITSNGESGIEIVMGGSNMKISNNIIRDNHASGIALQFYKDNSELGDFLIAGNELIGNDNYGLACKRPSGGRTPRQYWAKSTRFEYNRVRGNKKGIIHSGCKFHGSKKWEVYRTKEAQEKLNQTLTEIKATYKTMPEKEMVAIVNERMGDDNKLNQEDGWWQQEIDTKKKKEVDKIVDEVEWNYNEVKEKNEKLLASTSEIKEFFLGPHKQVLEDLKGDLDSHNFAVKKTKKIVNKMEIEYIKIDALQQIDKIEQRKELQEMYDQYNNKFGIWPWIKGLF